MEKKEKKEFALVYMPGRRKELSDRNAQRTNMDFISVQVKSGKFAEELMSSIEQADGYEVDCDLMFNCITRVDITLYTKSDDHDSELLFNLPEQVFKALMDTKVIRKSEHTVTAGYSMTQVAWQPQETERIEITVSEVKEDK